MRAMNFGILSLILQTFGPLVESNNDATMPSFLVNNYPAEVLEDARLDVVRLVQKYRYPIEAHYVETEDKYIVCVHRLPRPGAKPIFLMHGLTDSSSGWLIMGPWNGLGFFLYDNGYDVWMGNARGNRYSRNHSYFNPDVDHSFWRFSWHEIGYYDLPAMIDYVLAQTSSSKLGYFGHSQGTTSFWVMCSLRPEYNEKISIMSAVAPVAFMKHAKTPLVPLFQQFLAVAKDSFTEFVPHTEYYNLLCFSSRSTLELCLQLLGDILGHDPQQMNFTRFPAVVGHVPAGCDIKQFHHYIQLHSSNRFCQFDYGSEENWKRYGRLIPPDYPLEKVTANVALYYTQNDYLANVIDVQRLAKLLPNVIEDHLYPHPLWNHVAALWGIEARELAHKHMLNVLRQFNDQ